MNKLSIAARRSFAFAAAALLLAALAACGGQSDPDKFPDPGRVVVQARDTSARPVAGVLAELRTADQSLVWRSGTTGADGSVEIGLADGGVMPSDYALTLKLPPGYGLAPGQAAVTPVSVRSNQLTSVQVTLTAP
ncbi:hypothetical protein LZ009_13860 [Ramlibacter sp. XY19]|uniref:hypothetical protein n=1 Tax=Ramlibacter paludis TaxID=2908000 RepID=UPI0023DAAA8F|nr:hypothetical protein [Ramlibacter paludis]MCG2593865.1 hypothetical protein [Ramlibacter paludis]